MPILRPKKRGKWASSAAACHRRLGGGGKGVARKKMDERGALGPLIEKGSKTYTPVEQVAERKKDSGIVSYKSGGGTRGKNMFNRQKPNDDSKIQCNKGAKGIGGRVGVGYHIGQERKRTGGSKTLRNRNREKKRTNWPGGL